MEAQFLGALLLTLAVFIGGFLLAREFVCWYFKINARLAAQERTNRLLEQVVGRQYASADFDDASSEIVGEPAPSAPKVPPTAVEPERSARSAYEAWVGSRRDEDFVEFIDTLVSELQDDPSRDSAEELRRRFPEAVNTLDFQAVISESPE